jgi:preprotein translocase subunit SecF
MLAGIVSGTYSTVSIASALAVLLSGRKLARPRVRAVARGEAAVRVER